MEEVHGRYPASRTSTSTFRYGISEQTKDVRGGSGYNPDISPYQDTLLKKNSELDLTNPAIREDLYRKSDLIRKHTRDQGWKIIAQGWDYLAPEKCEACKSGLSATDPSACTCEHVMEDLEWPKQLQDTVIEAAGRAKAIDTAFVTRWNNGIYEWWTHNDVYNRVIVDPKYRKIEEVYFKYRKMERALSSNNQTLYNKIVGFLTQYSEDDVRPSRYYNYDDSNMIYKDCVVIQPRPTVRNVFGEPMLEIELETAAQKKYLRSYEFAYLHTGGSKKTTVVPNGVTSDVKDTVVKDTRRGIFSRGVVLEVKAPSDQKTADMVLVATQEYPVLPFDRINSMVDQDAQLTKQTVEGSAETGALGGKSPEINFKMDEISRDADFLMFEEIIRDINEVFFDVPGYDIIETKLASGRTITVRKPLYRIAFRKPSFITQPNSEEPDAEKEDLPEEDKLEEGEVMEAHAVSSSDGFVAFEGNLFQSGVYEYGNRNKERYVYYTKDEIKALTEEPVKRHYLEVNHSTTADSAFPRNIGYVEIMGYDDKNGKDISRFFIRKNLEPLLRNRGIIKDSSIRVSPRFVRRYVPSLGRKQLFLKNAAVLDPTMIPRANLTGLDTSAKLVN